MVSFIVIKFWNEDKVIYEGSCIVIIGSHYVSKIEFVKQPTDETDQ